MCNVYTKVQPLYFFAKVLGMFPMSFKGPMNKGNLETKLFDVFLTSLSFFLLFALICVKLMIINSVYDKIERRIILGVFVLLSIMMMLVIQFLIQVSNRNNIRKFISSLHNFDNEVREKSIQSFFLRKLCTRKKASSLLQAFVT